jgi:hypothetical protein
MHPGVILLSRRRRKAILAGLAAEIKITITIKSRQQTLADGVGIAGVVRAPARLFRLDPDGFRPGPAGP